jgi:hypothetical protein
MDAEVIAEGIEREGELATVRELGIEYGQGYLLGRPADLEAIKAGLAGGAPAPAAPPEVVPPSRLAPPPVASHSAPAAPPRPAPAWAPPVEPPVEPPPAVYHPPRTPSFAFPDDEPMAEPPPQPFPEAPEGGQPMLPPGFDED